MKNHRALHLAASMALILRSPYWEQTERKEQTMPEETKSQAWVPSVPDKKAQLSAGAVWVMHCRYTPVHPFIIITGGPSFFGD